MAKETTPSSESSDSLQADVVASTVDTSAESSAEAVDAGLETVEVPVEPAHFEDWNLTEPLMRALGDMGYDRPMPVQEAVITTLTNGHDMMVQSKTGSGKTAAFGIPIAQMLSDGKKGVQAMILAPTRELALQVGKEITKLVMHMDVAVVPIYGGAPIGPQIKQLEDGGQIVAGTPGRVLDHIRRGTMKTAGIRMLVLDECDEMLSMGFQEEIENIVGTLPAKEERQTMLFSATIPKEIERIGRRHMREPEMLTLSSDSVGAELIDHYYYVVSGMARNRDLLKLMKAEKPESAIIFCNTRDETKTVARYLRKNGYDAEALSSDLSQADRERVMVRMRDKNLNFLVATDIAARGIDISELSHVINYTFPASPEVYVHRSGRTGRAGKEGTALSLVGPREIGAFYYLKLIYKIIPTERDLPNADEMAVIEEGELYEQVIAMLEGDARKEHIALARRLWQSNEGERVVALLLRQLLTDRSNKSTAPARTTTNAKPAAAVPSAAAQPAASERDEEPRKRRRRRREREETPRDTDNETTVSAVAVAAPAQKPADVTAKTGAPAVEVSTTEPDAEERPKRKRRRRRGKDSEEESTEAKAETIPETAPAEAAPTEAVTETAPAEAVAETAPAEAIAEETPTAEEAPAEAAEAETTEAPAAEESAADADASATEERPKRKRRRRGRGSADREGQRESSSETGTEASASADEDAKAEEQVAGPGSARKTKKKTVKGRTRKPKVDAGVHGEFWEAWADNKQDSDTKSAPESSKTPATGDDATTLDEEEAKPAKRRRRRRGSKDDVESETNESPNDDVSAEKSSSEGSASEDAIGDVAAQSVRLFVNVGKREDADIDAIRDFLGEALGESAEQLGRITLRNTHCYVRVPEEIADEVIDTCTGLVFQERDVVVERARAKR
ncbi:MAG: DEAD/DEAH box helicase [Myxococcales bacterium]|nr:DEAD/DEAH box helicase [Myxococcales bacterium]